MQFTWRCQKCFRYLSNIENTSKTNSVSQRTVCPRCKSENRVTLSMETVVVSCGFSRKFSNNLKKTQPIEAPITKTVLLEKVGKEVCKCVKIVVKKQRT